MKTEELAGFFHVKPQTVRASLCRNGHYFGLRPDKLPNRMLDWPDREVEALRAGKFQPAEDGKVAMG